MNSKSANPRNKGHTNEDNVRAIVIEDQMNGPHGPYFVAVSEKVKDGSITCSLFSETWSESRYPRKREIVILSGLTKTTEGWRASSGRFLNLSDEQSASGTIATSNEQ